MKDKVTILIPTHYLPSAPSTNIIEQTIHSVSSIPGLAACDILIGYDMPKTSNSENDDYFLNLAKLTRSASTGQRTQLHYIPGAQQRESFTNLIKHCETPYFLFLEHDWIFIKQPDIVKTIEVMDKYPHINTVYFNKRPNVKHQHEQYIVQDTDIKELNLCKTSKWSNNPNITRKSIWDSWWMDLVKKAPLNRSNPRKQIEPAVHPLYKKDIAKLGFDAANALWGMYSYGEVGKDRMVDHLDGSQRY